jgi:uncharacterized protein (DUF58 family)
MWFNRQKKSSSNTTNQHSCQSILASLYSNGIHLSMQELLQYQSKSRLIDLTGKKNIHGKQSGNYLSRSKGRGMEFDEVRHYQTGDDVRAIDWRVTARTGKTHTKLFREEIERPVLIATDLSKSMQFGSKLLFKSVQAAHLASLVAWHAKSRGDRLGGLVFCNEQHIELKPRSRKAGVLHYLHALTTLNNKVSSTTIKATQETNQQSSDQTPSTEQKADKFTPQGHYFEQHCARLRQLAKPGSLVYLITDGHALMNTEKSQHALRHLSHISQHCELVVCIINDPLEQSLPESSMKLAVTLTDGIYRQQLTLGDRTTAQKYHQQAQMQHNHLTQKIIKAGARAINFSAAETLEQQLKNNEATV